MRAYLDFEKPVAELEAKVEELRTLSSSGDAVAIGDELGRLEARAKRALEELYAEPEESPDESPESEVADPANTPAESAVTPDNEL